MPETGTADLMTTIDQAFADAKHSAETAEPAGTPAAATDSPSDGATETATPAPETTDKAAVQGAEAAATDQLLSQDEEAALKGQSPEERMKAMEANYTRKTQALAEERRKYEPYAQLEKAMEQDPAGVLERVAKHYGVDVSFGQGKAAETKAETPVADDFLNALRADPELGFLADRLKPVFEAFEQRLTKQVVEKEIAPLKTAERNRQTEAAKKDTEKAFEEFGKDHKGWDKHAAELHKLSEQLQPGKNMTQRQYLEALWDLYISRNPVEATKKVVERINKSAAAAEKSDTGVEPSKVSAQAPKFGSLDDAVEASVKAARQGVRWES